MTGLTLRSFVANGAPQDDTVVFGQSSSGFMPLLRRVNPPLHEQKAVRTIDLEVFAAGNYGHGAHLFAV